MAAPGPGVGGLLRSGAPLLLPGAHPARRFAGSLGAADSAPVHGGGSGAAAAAGGGGGGRTAPAGHRVVPRRGGGSHALRGPQAQQSAHPGDEFLPGAPLPSAPGHSPVLDSPSHWISHPRPVAPQLA